MRKALMALACGAALLAAGAYTWFWGLPALRGEAGPCSVTVHCPGGPAATVYYYELTSDRFCRSLRIVYNPQTPARDSGVFSDLPPGQYRILCDGLELARVTVTWEAPHQELWPDETWPLAPPR